MDGAKNILICFLYSFILLSLLFFAAPSDSLAGDKIRINGSGTGLEMMKPLIEEYGKINRSVSFEVEKPLGSSGAIKALLAGAVDIAVTSKPLEPEAISRGGKIRYFGKTPLAIVTEKNNPKKSISTKELEDIYSGMTKKWPNGDIVRPILRPNEDIDTKILKGLSPGMAEAVTKAYKRRGTIIAITDPESNEAVLKTIGSIGASGLTGVLVNKTPLNILALNGVVPSRKALADGSYPLAKDLHFIVTDKLPKAAAGLLDFIYSKRGRVIAENSGVLITADGR